MTPEQKQQFETWWEREGVWKDRFPGESNEGLLKRLCETAWSNGAYKNEAQDKIKSAVGIVGVELVWDALDEFTRDQYGTGAYDFRIQKDGSILNDETQKDLTESELSEFVGFCEKENA